MNKNKLFLLLLLAGPLLFGCDAESRMGSSSSLPKSLSAIPAETSSIDLSSESNINPTLLEKDGTVEFIQNKDGWNTWRLVIPVSIPAGSSKDREYATAQIALPEEWQPTDTRSEFQKEHDKQYPPRLYDNFVERLGEPDELIKIHAFSISDLEDYDWWMDSPDKLAEIISRTIGDLRRGPPNTISYERWEIEETEWLVRCAFTLDDFGGEGPHFCNLYAVYNERYEIHMMLDIPGQTLEDLEVRELIRSILNSWEIVSIDLRVEQRK